MMMDEENTEKDCIFCAIADGTTPADVVWEDEDTIFFNDISPKAKVHIVAIPKKHIESVATIGEDDGSILVSLNKAATKLAQDQKLDAYRLTFNAGKYQHVPHLHMHLLAGGKIEWSKL